MVKGPYSHGKTPDEYAREIRVSMARINLRLKRFRSVEENNLREVRKHVVEGVTVGVSIEEAAAVAGYSPKTVARWLRKGKRIGPRPVSIEKAREQLDRMGVRRRRTAVEELRISSRARALVRKAMEVAIAPEEFAATTGYTSQTVTRWFASVRHSLEQSQRQGEIASVRKSRKNRPPQDLSPVQYDQWLVQEERRRRQVLHKHGLRPKRYRNAKNGRVEVPDLPKLRSRKKSSSGGRIRRTRSRK